MTTVTIQLVLTLTSPHTLPVQIHKTVAISLGRNLDGTPMVFPFADPGTHNVGVLEVDLDLAEISLLESPQPSISVAIARLAPDGTLAVDEIHRQFSTSSVAYNQLMLLAEEYKSGNSFA